MSKSLTRAAVPRQCHAPYRQAVAQTPKNFAIERVTVTPYEPAGRVRTSTSTAVPTRFFATVYLAEPRMVVEMVVRVAVGGQARVTELRIETDPRDSISTTTLRRVLIDPMLRSALAEASIPIDERSEVVSNAYRAPGTPDDSFAADAADDRVRYAAQIYGHALASGSRAPTEAVALEMHVSKATASRHVREARKAGLLPKRGASGPYPLGARVAAETLAAMAERFAETGKLPGDGQGAER